MKRIVGSALAAASLAFAAQAAADEYFTKGRELVEDGRYAEALFYLHAAAGRDDARAAELLGFMYSYGEEMFPGVDRNSAAAARWFAEAARGGRPVSRYLSCKYGGEHLLPQCLKEVARN
jgi:TPR repeat protein